MPLDHFDKFEIYTNTTNDSKFTFLIQKFESPIWSIYNLNMGDIRIQYGAEGTGYIASGYTRPDGWFFLIQQSGKRARINGQKLTKGSAFIIPPGYAIHFSTKTSHEWLTIFIPNNILNIQINKSPIIQKSDHIVSLNLKLLNHFLRRLNSQVHSTKFAADTKKVSIQLFRSLIINSAKSIILNLEVKKRYQGRKKLDRKNIVAKALMTINSTELINLDLDKLVRGANVSERTLRASFQEFFGVSPVKYLLLLKLYKARHMIHDLKYIDETIIFISTSLGFWDQGRFARRYQLLFGELPSHAHTRTKKKFGLMLPSEHYDE